MSSATVRSAAGLPAWMPTSINNEATGRASERSASHQATIVAINVQGDDRRIPPRQPHEPTQLTKGVQPPERTEGRRQRRPILAVRGPSANGRIKQHTGVHTSTSVAVHLPSKRARSKVVAIRWGTNKART